MRGKNCKKAKLTIKYLKKKDCQKQKLPPKICLLPKNRQKLRLQFSVGTALDSRSRSTQLHFSHKMIIIILHFFYFFLSVTVYKKNHLI